MRYSGNPGLAGNPEIPGVSSEVSTAFLKMTDHLPPSVVSTNTLNVPEEGFLQPEIWM